MIWAAKEMLVIYFLFDFRLQLFSLLRYLKKLPQTFHAVTPDNIVPCVVS